MAIRIRKLETGSVALCAAETDPEPGDIYLDDGQHYALAAKFALDWQGEIVSWQYEDIWADMGTQKRRDAGEELGKWLASSASQKREAVTMAGCYDCREPYDSPRFPDMMIPNWAWERINPSEHEGGGLLCPVCIIARLHAEGLQHVPHYFASGPLIPPAGEDPPWSWADNHRDRLAALEERVFREG